MMGTIRIAVVLMIAATLACSNLTGSGLLGTWRLSSVDGNTLPVQYFADPGGTFVAVVHRGELDFESDERVIFDRTIDVINSGGSSSIQRSISELRYELRGRTILLFAGGFEPDRGQVTGNSIVIEMFTEDISLGEWRFVR